VRCGQRRDARSREASDEDSEDAGPGSTSTSFRRDKRSKAYPTLTDCASRIARLSGVSRQVQDSALLPLPCVYVPAGGGKPSGRSTSSRRDEPEPSKPPYFMSKVEKKSPSRFKKWQVRPLEASVPLRDPPSASCPLPSSFGPLPASAERVLVVVCVRVWSRPARGCFARVLCSVPSRRFCNGSWRVSPSCADPLPVGEGQQHVLH
jgi:hypothetical protein